MRDCRKIKQSQSLIGGEHSVITRRIANFPSSAIRAVSGACARMAQPAK
jgi:hypothetical protein